MIHHNLHHIPPSRAIAIAFLFIVLNLHYLHSQTVYDSIKSDNYFAPENVLSFAEWLYRGEGDFARAADEYARYAFLKNPTPDSVLFRRAFCLKKIGRLEESISVFDTLRHHLIDKKWLQKSNLQLAHTWFLKKEYSRSMDVLENILASPNDPNHADFQRLMYFDLMAQKRWDNAERYVLSLDEGISFDEVQSFVFLARQARLSPRKDPTTAGILSAIVPGSGRFYTGEWIDGLYSMCLVGISSWFAYDGFHAKGIQSVQGWIFGIFGITLHAGNIYGSIESARGFNLRFELSILEPLRTEALKIGESE